MKRARRTLWLLLSIMAASMFIVAARAHRDTTTAVKRATVANLAEVATSRWHTAGRELAARINAENDGRSDVPAVAWRSPRLPQGGQLLVIVLPRQTSEVVPPVTDWCGCQAFRHGCDYRGRTRSSRHLTSQWIRPAIDVTTWLGTVSGRVVADAVQRLRELGICFGDKASVANHASMSQVVDPTSSFVIVFPEHELEL
jgi:hypothetical protein